MVTTLLAGLSLGAIYAIVGIGYNIVFISSRVFNFAQAHFLMIGAFVMVELGQVFHLPFGLTLLIGAAVGAAIGALEELLAIRRLATRMNGPSGHSELVTTLGIATILTGLAVAFFGSDPQQITELANLPAFDLLGGRTNTIDVLLIAAAIVLALIVGLVTRRTMVGLSSLAASEDRSAAMLRGVNVSSLGLIAFAVAGGLLALLGPLVAAKTYATYDLGDTLAVKSFVSVAIGGFGSYFGAVLGGFIVGVLEMVSAFYLGSQWQSLVVFVLLLVVLVALPNGITGRARERAV